MTMQNVAAKKSMKYPRAIMPILRLMKADVYRSWCLSNSFLRISSALKALMVVRPSKDEFI